MDRKFERIVLKLSGEALAGSISTMDRLVRTVVQQAGIPMEAACRMIGEMPAKFMGIAADIDSHAVLVGNDSTRSGATPSAVCTATTLNVPFVSVPRRIPTIRSRCPSRRATAA